MAYVVTNITKISPDKWYNIKLNEWIPYKLEFMQKRKYFYNKESRTIQMSEMTKWDVKYHKDSDSLSNACNAAHNSRKLRPNDWGKIEEN